MSGMAGMDRFREPEMARTAPYALPNPCMPFPDESLPGLAMRNAEFYRLRDAKQIFSRIRPPDLVLWTLCMEDPDSGFGQRMRALLGLGEDNFRRMSMWTGSDTSTAVLGHAVWRDLIRPRVRASCPGCLRDSRHHRAVWLLDVMPACAIHGTQLVTRCPNPKCGRRQNWIGVGVHRCGAKGCGFDLRDAAAASVDDDAMGGVRGLHRLLHHAPQAGGPLGMPFGSALRTAFTLGRYAHGLAATQAPGFIAREGERLPHILNSGWNALQDWPHGFHRLLDGMRRRSGVGAGGAGLRAIFGGFSKQVYDWTREPWGGPIGIAFAEFAASQPDLATTAGVLSRYAGDAELDRRHVRIAEAARNLGISGTALHALAGRRGLLVDLGIPNAPTLLRADAVREIGRQLPDCLLPEQARAMLGVGTKVMVQLEATGLVRRVPEAERIMEFRPFSRLQIEGFLLACSGSRRAIPESKAKRLGLLPILSAVAPWRTATDLCRALFEGRLVAAATVTGRIGLLRVRLKAADVEAAFPSGRGTLSMVEAGREMGIRHMPLHVWARRGLLETVVSSDPRETGARVTREGLARFRAEYVTSGELAETFGQGRNTWLARLLEFGGIRPISGPGIDGSEATLLRRSDCTPEALDAVRRRQAKPAAGAVERRRLAFERVGRAARTVAGRWHAEFDRRNNHFMDPKGGRVLQIIVGARASMTGGLVFDIGVPNHARLAGAREAWVALVPREGEHFLLVPFGLLSWRRDSSGTGRTTVAFDKDGRPGEMVEWSVPLTPEAA